MTKYELVSLVMSGAALLVAGATAIVQYQISKEAVVERLNVELKMVLDGAVLSPLDVRIISGVPERASMKSAILITNVGQVPVRILEIGYEAVDFPTYYEHSAPAKSDSIAPGEQRLVMAPNLISVRHQLIQSVSAPEGGTVFAVTTRANRFEGPATVRVAP